MENVNVTLNTQQHKSNAPWILGIIAFVLSIPNILCATLCAAVVATGTAVTEAAVVSSGTPVETPDTESTAASMGWLLTAVIISSILCFIFSFFGKSKISHIAGAIVILGAILILGTAIIGFGSWIWGIAAGVLYLLGGIFSIINKKRLD